MELIPLRSLLRAAAIAGGASVLAGAVLAAQNRPAKPQPARRPPAAAAPKPAAGAAAAVSFHKQITPILQARCQGCHQSAKPGGGYDMMVFSRLVAGGDSKLAAVVPGQPEKSHLLEMIVPQKGQALMPKGGKPLASAEIDLVRRWIAQGAADDTPHNVRSQFDAEHPPVYTRAPVITSLDFSPDGQLLAVAGFHEVLLMNADGSQRLARLVGVAERIESVRFSPDGKLLAVTGGLPGRTGEVQIWNVADRKLLLSVPITQDTLYGASWSPDSSKIAFACSDKSVRAIDARTGEQVLFMGSHDDWSLNTVFSADGSHLVSVGRDGTAKLTELATQRFIDNITSITPGALKGGIASVARHPTRDEIVIGGADGTPKVYRMFRLTDRRIGDDSNMIRYFPAMSGRVVSVAVSRDGKRIAAGSSLDGKGEVDVFSYEFDTRLPDNIKAIMSKVSTERSAAENASLEKYHTDGVRRIWQTAIAQGGIYAVAFRPDGQVLAAAGTDGNVRLMDTADGKILNQFVPVPISKRTPRPLAPVVAAARDRLTAPAPKPATLPAGLKSLEVIPPAIRLGGKLDYVQLVVTARTTAGAAIDVTRQVRTRATAPLVTVSSNGLVTALNDGVGTLQLSLGTRTVGVPLQVTGSREEVRVDYVRDVMPVISRLGCNAGTCHGSAKGKNGFKLSLRGYDPVEDVRAFTDDLSARRVNLASPENSLMLLKSTGSVPHAGGQVSRPGEPYYEILRAWIAGGAVLDANTAKVARIEVLPQNPIVQKVGGLQQMRIIATYGDGKTRDVTREAFIESGNTEVATADRTGAMEALRRGEAPILARYEGAYAATTLTVMGNRAGFVWKDPPTYNPVDEAVAAKWKRMKILPSDICSDTDFIRRITLDLVGLPPTADEVRAFTADPREGRVKREELIDRLIGSKDFIEFWTNKWADLLQVNRKFLAPEGAAAFRQWIRGEVANNTPYDQFARKILTASGSNRENPAASYFKILRDPGLMMENTTHLFLATRFNCNKCHDHPFERWTQDQYYQTAAFFAQVGLKADPAGGSRQIGGTAVEGGKPMYEVVYDRTEGEMTHLRTGKVAPPRFPFKASPGATETASRREQLAGWITSRDNPYFARSYVNRIWGYLFGVGIIEPIDDIRAGNPASNPELLDRLTQGFVESNFNTRELMRLICKSRTYQLSLATNRWNTDDRINYAHALARRLPAEVLYDTVLRVTGSVSKIPGVPVGTRAAELPDSGVELPSGFLATFGRPARESACECERSTGMQLGPVMALVSGPTVAEAIGDPENAIARLVEREQDDVKVIQELFMRVLNRPAAEKEIQAALADLRAIDADHQKLVQTLKEREAADIPVRARKEREREEAMTRARAELTACEKELAPRLAEQERQKQARTAQLEAELARAEESLPAKLAALPAAKAPAIQWTVLDPTALKTNGRVQLKKEGDLSVTASGPAEKSVYTFTAETSMKGITGIRLEALTDPSLPRQGPGRAADGNFVLTEFVVTAAPKAAPQQGTKIPLQDPLADFSQASFGIGAAIDGDFAGGAGWAVAPQMGGLHWATFTLKEPAGFDGGTVLTFSLHNGFNGNQHALGRFRISVSTNPAPIGLSLAADLAAATASPPQQWTPALRSAVTGYFRAADNDLRGKFTALEESKKPLPVDPKLKELRDQLEYVSRPVPPDPALVQLRSDVALSTKQAANQRITAAQDLAWALINSPAFLFNH